MRHFARFLAPFGPLLAMWLAAGWLAIGPALAASGETTITVKDGNAAPQTYDVIQDANSHFMGMQAGGTDVSVAMQSAAVANGNGSTLTVTGYSVALINVNCSVACSGGTTVNFEGTDSTGTYFPIAGASAAASACAVNATTSGQFWVSVAGLTTIRARISGYSAGTITVTGTPFYGNMPIQCVANGTAPGQANNAGSGPVVISSQQMLAAGAPSTTQVETVQGVDGMHTLWSTATPSTSASVALSHLSGASASITSLVLKNTSGNLYDFNCSAITGGVAGFCIAYNGASAPSTGALTAGNVIDFCEFGTTAAGCSFSRIPMAVNASSGIVILISSASTPYTYTTGTLTGAIEGDYD